MNETFGKKIKELRKSKDLTLKQLSDKSGIELTYLSKLENDKLNSLPSEETINKIVGALGLDNKVKDDLFILAKKIPSDYKEDFINKPMFAIYRSSKGLSDEEMMKIAEEIEEKKKKK